MSASWRPTLCAVATGSPDGAIAVVRLSGPEAASIAASLCGRLPPPRRASVRHFVRGGEPDERIVVVSMPGPASFTGEDVVELHVHAGARNVRSVLEACVRAGARAAEPGEFSRRAFEHGRMGLDELEGVAALLAAQTDEALIQARRLAAGELGRAVEARRVELGELRVEIEAHLDFPDETESSDRVRWHTATVALIAALEGWLAGFEAGRRARERAVVVVVGPPNAGKSSLFNALLGRPRALVADQPGTTRDYVEAELELGRHGCTLVDTAGIRASENAIEAAGVALAHDQIAGADVVIWVEAADTPPVSDPPDAGGACWIRVESKRDLGCGRPEWLGVGAIGSDDRGVDELRARLTEYFGTGAQTAWIGLARHRERASEAVEALRRSERLLDEASGLEMVAFELAVAEHRLAEITGRATLGPVGEAVLRQIFARFCIGK